MGSSKGLLIFGAVLGLVILIAGAYIGFKILPDYLNYRIAKEARLEPGSPQYQRWKDPPYKMPYKIYLFSIKNPDYIQSGDKPELAQIGPCVYNQVISREEANISHDYSTGTIKYSQYRKFIFDQELSFPYCAEDQEITVLNVPLNAAFQMVENFDEPIKDVGLWFLNLIMEAFNVDPDNPSMFIKTKVKDYLFGGYEFCKQFGGWGSVDIVCIGLKLLTKAGLCDYFEFQGYDKPILFSFLRKKELMIDGIFNISSGLRLIRELGSINTWNQVKYTQFWSEHNSECDKVAGTDATIYSPFKDSNSVLTIYNTDICRTVNMKYVSDVTHKEVHGLLNVIERDTFTSAQHSYKYSCFCTKHVRDFEGERNCHPDGFLDLTTCVGIPLLASHPHMMWSDEDYNSSVNGLEANETKHASFVEIEPHTGQPLRSAQRLQYNMIIRPIDSLDVTKQLTPAVIPILWIDEQMEIPDDLLENLKSSYLNNIPIVEITKWTLISVGAVLCISCLLALFIIKIISYS